MWTLKDFKQEVALKIQNKSKKGKYTTKGPNFVHSLGGHDTLVGY